MTVTERILAQSAELFIRNGIKAITMDDISNEAGVSKRTIYENFRDKDHLLSSCLSYMDDIHNKESEEIFRNSENTIDMVFKIMKQGVRMINNINPVFFTDLKKYHFQIWNESYKSKYEERLNQTYTTLKSGINEDLFRKNINVEIVAKLLHEQLKIMADEQIFPSDTYSKTSVFENIMINFLRGIATMKGLEIIDNYQNR